MAEQTEVQTEQPEQLDLDAELEAMRQAEQEAEPGPTPEPEAPAQPEPEPQQENTVPLGAFRELRDEFKATKSQNQQLQSQNQQLQKQMQDMQSSFEDRMAELQDFVNPPPDPENHPHKAAALESKKSFAKLEGDIGELKKAIEGNSEQTQVYNLQTRIQEAERQFTQEHPDYPKAFEHIKEQRLKQYQILGMDESNWGQEAASYIQRAVQSGTNPAAMVYELAKEMGYTPETSDPEPKQEAKAEVKSLKEQAQKIQAAKSLSGASGSQPKGEIQDMEAADVDNLDDSEFDRLFTGPDGEKNWQKLHS